MTTANTDTAAHGGAGLATGDGPNPGGPKGRGSAASSPAAKAFEDAKAAAGRAAVDEKAAQAAKAAQAEAEAKAKKAALEAAAAKAKQEDLERLEKARRHLRKATPDDPIPLRRVETASPVGDTLYGTPRNVIDLRNDAYVGITLLFDGQVVHVINGREPSRSFWIGYSNIAAMYPRFDI